MKKIMVRFNGFAFLNLNEMNNLNEIELKRKVVGKVSGIEIKDMLEVEIE